MATDQKKHTTIAAAEKPTRAGLAAAILSINDIIPVANLTEANQVATAVAASGQNLATNPVFVARADARGLHRIEYSYNGTTWIPASGVLSFASKSPADAWASTNAAYLVAGDTCLIGADEYTWSGAAWEGGVGAIGSPPANTVWDVTLSRLGKRVYAEGRVYKSSGTFASQETVGLLASGFRPVRAEVFIGALGVTTGAAWVPSSVYIQSNGSIQVNMQGIALVNVVGFTAMWERA